MPFFMKKYKIRRFGELKAIKGHQTASYSEFEMDLDVQTEAPDEMTFEESGQRTAKKLKSWSKEKLVSADAKSQTKADLLNYCGEWYECISSVNLPHTILSHWRSEWQRVPEGSVKDQ